MKSLVEKWFESNYDQEFFLYRGCTYVGNTVVISYDQYSFGEVEASYETEIDASEL